MKKELDAFEVELVFGGNDEPAPPGIDIWEWLTGQRPPPPPPPPGSVETLS